jgi:hypothetical protein
VNFRRLLRADVVVMVAALVLLLVMAMDWYSTQTGDEARRIQALSKSDTGSAAGDDAEKAQREDAQFAAESAEKNAWQETGLIDRLILIGLLGTVVLSIAAAWMRAAGRRFEPPSTPTTAATLVASVTALLVVYRIIQEPGPDQTGVVKAGAPLAVVVLAVIALAGRMAMAREGDGTAWEAPLESPADDRP